MSNSRGVILEWREFNISIPEVRAWIGANLPDFEPSFSANSRGLIVKLYGEDYPSEADKDSLRNWWESLTETDDAATKYYSMADFKAAVAAARQSAVGKLWDDMTIAEQKVIAGVDPTPEELGLI